MQGETCLIIFDCDGVLIDSEPLSIRIESEELTRAGFPYSASEIGARFTGMSEVSMYAAIEQDAGRPLPSDLNRRVHERLMAAFRRELVAIDGIHDVLDHLDAIGIHYCVASSSTPERLDITLNHVGLRDRFAAIFSATMVKRGKPAPDLFLYAAANMDVAPGRCVVVEDSVAGVTAARAAGMAVVGFSGGGHCLAGHDEMLTGAGADKVAGNMGRLPGLLHGLLGTQNVV
jgi:HAD superfamily hydrolase (TIGR01509 family)